MYLEEQLEQVAVDHGRQIESIAKGLDELTSDVRAVRQDMNDGFARIDDRFIQIDKRFDQMDGRFDEMQQIQQLILKLVTERLP